MGRLPLPLGLACALVLLALAVPAGAGAAGDTPAGVRELWKQYPLAGGAARTATPEPARPASTAGGSDATTAPAPADGEPSALLIVALLLAATAAIGSVAIARARAGRRPALATLARPALDPAAPRPALDAAAPPRPLAATPAGRAATQPGTALAGAAAPPDRERIWNARVEWREQPGDCRFVVVARSPGAADAVIADSAPFEWPPSSISVKELAVAVEELERKLLAAGWDPMPRGDAWYARQFAWASAAIGQNEDDRRFVRRHAAAGSGLPDGARPGRSS